MSGIACPGAVLRTRICDSSTSTRRSGLGTQAIQALLKGHLRGAQIVQLDVHPDNAAAMAFWRANGFVGVPQNMQFVRQL